MNSSCPAKDYDRFSRQIVLPEVGAAGQKKISSSRVFLFGDPAIAEVALESLTASGVGFVELRHDRDLASGEASAEFAGRVIRAWAGHGSSGVGDGPAAPSPLAAGEDFVAAGYLLALEVLKAIIGVETSGNWRLS